MVGTRAPWSERTQRRLRRSWRWPSSTSNTDFGGRPARGARGQRRSSPHILLGDRRGHARIPQTLGLRPTRRPRSCKPTAAGRAPAGRQSIATSIRRGLPGSSVADGQDADARARNGSAPAAPTLLPQARSLARPAGRRLCGAARRKEGPAASRELARREQATAADRSTSILPTRVARDAASASTYAAAASGCTSADGRQNLRRSADEVMDRFRARRRIESRRGGDGGRLVSVRWVCRRKATVMLIFDARSNAGLAQLHQLRGRSAPWRGRSYCILVSDAYGRNRMGRNAARPWCFVSETESWKAVRKDLSPARAGSGGLTQGDRCPAIVTLADRVGAD